MEVNKKLKSGISDAMETCDARRALFYSNCGQSAGYCLSKDLGSYFALLTVHFAGSGAVEIEG
jgi:hypothetical protein